jgi:hypothetical protein
VNASNAVWIVPICATYAPDLNKEPLPSCRRSVSFVRKCAITAPKNAASMKLNIASSAQKLASNAQQNAVKWLPKLKHIIMQNINVKIIELSDLISCFVEITIFSTTRCATLIA